MESLDKDSSKKRGFEEVETTTTTEEHPISKIKVENEDQDPTLENPYKVPVSHSASMKEHYKVITSITVDNSGSRMLTSSFDCMVKFWDYAGMDSSLKSFREIEPWEATQIKSLAFSPTGDRFIVAGVTPLIKIFDRDGFERNESLQGDMYIRDMVHTKGHVTNVSNLMWDPSLKGIFLSGSTDGTVRIWEAEKMNKGQKTVIKTKSPKGNQRNGVTYASYSFQGNQIAAGCQDGSIQIWPKTGPYLKPVIHIQNAHFDGSDITSLAFHSDCSTMISRATDDTMKIWDLRKTAEPIKVIDDLPTFGHTNVIFSPTGDLIVTGTSPAPKKKETGLLTFWDKTTLQKVKQIGVEPEQGVTITVWHPKINQLMVGTTSGRLHMYYDPSLSVKGALMCVNRRARTKDPNDFEAPRIVQTPNALPMYADEEYSRREFREKYNPKNHAKSDILFTSGPGKGGKIGSSLTQYLMQNYIKKDEMRDQDPREAILKFADEAEKNPMFFGAYKKTQPKAIFDYSEELEDPRDKLRKEKKS